MRSAAQEVQSEEVEVEAEERQGDPISRDLEFMADLSGSPFGTGKIPKDRKKREKYLKGLRHHLKETRNLTDAELSRQITIYSKVNGPSTIRSIWAGRLKMEDVTDGMMGKIILH